MNRWMIVALLVGSVLLMAGCMSSQSTAPDYRPPTSAVSPPSHVAPSAPVVPSLPVPSVPSSVPPVVPPTPSQPVPPVVPVAPANVSPNNTTAPAFDACAGQSGDALVQCEAKQAVDLKDVTVCTNLTDKDSRFKCITIWCSSSGRDYRQCDHLTNYDDHMACLNKCNPNANT